MLDPELDDLLSELDDDDFEPESDFESELDEPLSLDADCAEPFFA